MDKDSFEKMLRNRIEEHHQTTLNGLGQIDKWPPSRSTGILQRVLALACQAQNFHRISEGRMALAAMPRDWLTDNLPLRVSLDLDLDDEWEFRRLLELLEILGMESTELFRGYLQFGLEVSNNPEVTEAAVEFQKALEARRDFASKKDP
jgi:hypothetical protein